MGFSLFLCSVFLLFLVSHGESDRGIARDKEALVSFKAGIVSDPMSTLEDWNSSNADVCEWSGVRCDQGRYRVVELDLSGRSLDGRISSSLANLSSLSILDLSRNSLRGHIPRELGRLSRLGQLSLSSNVLTGRIPHELGFLGELVYLDLGSNALEGRVPSTLLCDDSSGSLQYIDLSNNSLTGEIPLREQCEVKELRFLLLWSNRFVGPIPRALSKSSKLEWLDVESNMLGGELPSEIVREMPQLQFLYLSYNHFISHDGNTNLEPFFTSLVNSSNLQELELAGNDLGGVIPSSIGDLSDTNLVQIHLDENRLYGSIPPQISNLVNLTLLNLSSNLLNGTIPPELCRMSKLERVYLSNNSLSGSIPTSLGNAPHLGLLDLSRNKLSGSIPDSFSNLAQLRKLFLYDNELSGTVPPSLGKCVNLEILDLSKNRLSGLIPGEVAGLRSLKIYLNLSSNNFNGPLPLELSKMDMVLSIDLSSNNLSGTIPPQLESCVALESFNLSGNALQGPLPGALGQLPYLRQLDVSSNRLSGSIPQSLQESMTLIHLNLSFNRFSGNVSGRGAFAALNMDSFKGNNRLCGMIQGMPRCKRKRARHLIMIPIFLPIFLIIMLSLSCYSFIVRPKIRRRLSIFSSDVEEGKGDRNEMNYPRISYRELIDATGGFSPTSLIGSGRFGQVYKGVLQDNTRIAVKVLDLKEAGIITGSFKRECQILKRLRHRNLIRIITICSRPDFKALVLPLMSNGSLEKHLYPSQHGERIRLNLAQVVSICNDVAEAVAYLHHHSPMRVVHCDLKPSNILLDEDLTALVTDFGIARLLNAVDESNNPDDARDSKSYTSADGLLCGSVGYIAPEYGMGKSASTQGDVYSFGVLLLEIVTGKRPTDAFSVEGSCLHEWVKTHYPNRLQPLVEQALEKYSMASIPKSYARIWSNVVLEMIELGLICTQYNPSLRPSMQDVAHEMGRLKEYVSNPSAFLIEEIEQNS